MRLAAAEHLAPVALDGMAYALQGTEVPRHPEVRIVPLQEAVQVQGLLSNRQVPRSAASGRGASSGCGGPGTSQSRIPTLYPPPRFRVQYRVKPTK